MQPYDHTHIEPKWQKIWAKNKAGEAKDPKKGVGKKNARKFYALIEFPYPSGDGLHVGHIRSNTAMDIISHKRRREGYDVLYPIGWDAFGLPTENYAIKTGIQPAVVTKKNTDTFRRQLKSLGFFFDWSREINTTDPKYYKWTQWIFLQFLKEGLAYKKKMTINWCPKDLIGLANEEVIDGKCERCGTPVEKREKEQWMLAITKYAEKLLEGLDATDYVMPKLVDKVNPHRPGAPVIKRNVAHAIVFDPRTKKYLIIRNKKHNWDTVVIGGIEEGETPEQTARREVREETGYTDLEFKRLLGGMTEAQYYTKHKGENRIAYAQAAYFELKSDARVALADGEDTDNEILWVDEADFVPGKMVNSELGIWLERIKNPQLGWPKPLLDWADSIKDSQRNWIGKSEGAEFDFALTKKYKYVLVHGYKSRPTDAIYPWLKNELEKKGHSVTIVVLPNPDKPSEKEQVDTVLATMEKIGYDENTILYGHSLGTVIAMKVTEKLQKKIAGLVLAGGFIDCQFCDHPRPFDKTFNWKFDSQKIRDTVGFIKLLHDVNDVAISEGQADRLGAFLKTPITKVTAEDSHFDGNIEPTILKALTPSLTVFTTRPDTLFGVTYVVVAPEHPLVEVLLSQLQNKKEVADYIVKAKNQTDIIRTDAKREKTGVELKDIHAINPANNEEIPVWIADYVLADYGTGAVMAVPAHDERDFDFAKKYKLPVRQVIAWETGIQRPNEERRDGGCAVIFDPKTQKYAFGRLPDGKYDLYGGGVDAKEDLTQGILREIEEESGLHDFNHIETLDDAFVHYYNFKKKVARVARATCLFVTLASNAKKELHQESHENYTLTWSNPDEVIAWWETNNKNHDYDHWIIFLKKGVARAVELGFDTTNKKYSDKQNAYTGDGMIINSADFSGTSNKILGSKIATQFGTPKTTFKLRDWVFSRQRYWGEPIPVIHCPDCGIVPVPEKDLPVKLPEVKNYQPTQTGESPLAAISDWVNVKCPKCGSKKAKRETDTMPQWAGSSWYYLRYTDPKNTKNFAAQNKLKYWTPVDWYNGGNEHTTLHLLYSRFWHKFLFDQGLVPTSEPYTKRTSHGLILAKGGEKMSKSKGNVVNPDGIVEAVGADSLRLYEMFMGPFDQAIGWDENGIVGCRRFIEKVWKLSDKGFKDTLKRTLTSGTPNAVDTIIHKTIKKVTEDIEAMRFNTAVSAMMIAVNELEKSAEESGGISRENYSAILLLLAPFIPHVTEELWQKINPTKGKSTQSIHKQPWPTFDPAKIAETTLKIAVQINGKTRSSFEMVTNEANQMSEAQAHEKAVALDEIKKWIYGKEIKKVVYVKGRLINLVIA